MDMKFATWIVRSLYRAGFLKTVANYNLDPVAVQDIQCCWGWFSAIRRIYILLWKCKCQPTLEDRPFCT